MAKKQGGKDILLLAQQLATSLGYELVDAGFEKEAAGLYLRAYLDKPEGITLDDCEAFHRRFQPLVEDTEYDYLEVSSPGIDRPIKTAADAQKALGQQVEIKLYKPLDGQKQYLGRLEAFDLDGYHVAVGGEIKLFPLKAVALAKRFLDVDNQLKDDPQGSEESEHEQPEA